MTTPAKLFASILLAAGIFVAGYMANRQQVPVAPSASVKQALQYTCPMHPQYTSDRSGACPVCGMSLVPASPGNAASNADAKEPPGMTQISTERQQLIGVRTDEVKRAPATHLLRVPGRITVDDQRLYRIIAAADGWIRELGRNTPGSFVKRNEVLGTFYTTNFVASLQTFLYSLQTLDSTPSGTPSPQAHRNSPNLNLQIAIDSLRNIGMNDLQIEEIHRTRKAVSEVNIYAPIAGFVIARNVSPEQRFDKGFELYRIADIGKVWVMTDIFEKDREFLKPGAGATVRYQGRDFQARMSDALPQFDAQSRTLKTRFELENPGFILRPDMFVDVEFHVEMPAALTVPADSIIDSGRRKAVYVESAKSGAFQPRLVETGWRLGDRVQITKGLEPGERIVVSGNFLIDSESRMKLGATAPAAMTEGITTAKDPVCGMDVDPNAPQTLKVRHGGKTYYFCSESCRKSFEANPEKYVQKEMAAQDVSGKRAPV